MPPELVNVKNLNEQPFSDGYAGTWYDIPPGGASMVPWGAAILWFGDPSVIDRPTLAQFDRREEVERLYQRLGCYDGDGHSRQERFTWNRPHVEVTTLQGEPVTMLVDDLDGSAQPRPNGPKPDERQALAGELERMKQVQAELLQRLHTLEAGNESFDELPTDLPTKIPVDEEAR